MSELPDLDESVSFIVDNGASVGPLPMREIVASVRSGERSSTSLVWWAGATDWCRFDAVAELVALAATETSVVPEVPPLSPALQSPIPTAEALEPTQTIPLNAVEPYEESAVAEVPEEVVSPQALDFEPLEPVTTIVQPEAAVSDSEPEVMPVAQHAVPAAEEAVPEAVEMMPAALHAMPHVDHEALPEAEHAMPAPEVFPTAAPEAAEAVELADPEPAHELPSREFSEGEESDDAPRPALTGLFSAGARSASAEAAAPSPDALDAILAARVSLESVGARIEALSSATRGSMTPDEFQAGLDEFEATAAAETQAVSAVAVEGPVEGSDVATPDDSDDGGSWTSVDGAAPDAADDTPGVDVPRSRAQLNERFQEMVRKSVDHQRRLEWVMRVDELLLSACITSIADRGFVAMDLASSNSDHRVLFSHNDDTRQVRLELTPLDSVGDHLGRHVRFGLSWGRDVRNVNGAFEVVRAQASDTPLPPGVLGCEIEMATATVLTNVELILAADDFVKDDYSVDRSSLTTAISAALQALESHWHDLFDDF